MKDCPVSRLQAGHGTKLLSSCQVVCVSRLGSSVAASNDQY